MRILTFLFILCTSQLSLYCQVYFKPKLLTSSSQIQLLFKQKKYKEAIALSDGLIEKDNANGMNYFTRAVLKYYSTSLRGWVNEDIISDCKQAVSNGFNDPEVSYLLFSQYCSCDQVFNIGNPVIDGEVITPEVAKKQIDEAVFKDYKDMRYLNARIIYQGSRFLGLGRFDMSDMDLENLERDCNSLISETDSLKDKSHAYFLLSRLYLRVHRDSSQALGYLTDAIDVNPQNVDLYDSRATLHFQLGQYHEAALDFSEYIRKSKRNLSDQYVGRGKCYFYLDNYSLALKDLGMAISILENDRQISLQKKANVGRVLYIKANLSEAYEVRGLVQVFKMDNIKACADFRRALSLGSETAQDLISEHCSN